MSRHVLVRPGFMGAHVAMLGAVLVNTVVQQQLIAAGIWLTMTALIVVYGREDRP